MGRLKNENGQSLIEVLVALAVMVIVILALVRVTTVSIRNATFAKNRALATKYAQEWIEETRKSRDNNSVSFFNDTNLCSRLAQSIGIFTRQITCSLSTDKKTMTVKVVVSWVDAQGTHKSELTTRLTKWK